MEKNKYLKEVIVKIEGKEWEEALDKAFKKVNATKTIAGFRKGKAPKKIFIKHYGIESLFYEASNICVDTAYKKMIEDNKDLNIAATPVLDIKTIDEKFIEYSFTLTLKPEVKLGKYKKLDVKKDKVTVTKAEISEEIKKMQEQYKEIIIKEGIIKSGDIAVIDYEGFKDGVAFAGGKGENYSLTIGSNTFIPGFEDALIGLKSGDEKDVELTFPKDYHEKSLAGEKVVFKVKVHEVKEIKLPELDSDFFEDLGMEGIDSKEKLESQVKENIKVRKEKDAEVKYNEELLDVIASDSTVEIPYTMIDEEVNHMIKHFEEHLMMQGVTLEQFYMFARTDEDKLKEEYKNEAEKRIKYRLIIEKMLEEEKVEVTDEEVESKVEEIAKKYNVTKEEVKKQYEDIEYIRYDMKVNKLLDIIKK